MLGFETIKAPPFSAPGRAGVVLPASAPIEASRLEAGLGALRNRGIDTVFDATVVDARGYLGAPDRERAAHVNEMLGRADLTTLFAVRGGYGAMRILDAVDYEALVDRPKLLVGYSDITALQFALFAHCGWTSIHGPMVAVEWANIDAATERHFWPLAGGAVYDSLAGPEGERLSSVSRGTTEGTLLGGNLSVIARLVGTAHLPPLDGAILFLEEVGELPYRIDALLAQLRLAGILDSLAGVVLGAFTDCDARPDRPSFTTQEVLLDYFSSAPYPVAEGLVYGHVPRKISMPFGIRARLSVSRSNARLSMLEPVTANSGAPV